MLEEEQEKAKDGNMTNPLNLSTSLLFLSSCSCHCQNPCLQGHHIQPAHPLPWSSQHFLSLPPFSYLWYPAILLPPESFLRGGTGEIPNRGSSLLELLPRLKQRYWHKSGTIKMFLILFLLSSSAPRIVWQNTFSISCTSLRDLFQISV